MKKIILTLAAAAAALAACTKAAPEPAYEQDSTLYRTGNVTLLASVEDFATKLEMPGTGHGLWKSGDRIVVYTSDGTPVVFSLEGTGDTKRAIFKGEIPAGKELGTLAVYPADAVISLSGNDLKVRVPDSYSLEDGGYKGVMTASIADSYEIKFKQMFSLATFNIKQYPANGVCMVIEEPGRNLSGEFTLDVETASVVGVTATAGTGALTVATPSAKSSFNVTIPVPVAEYKGLSASIYDEAGELVVSERLLESNMTFDRAFIRTVEKEFPKIKIKTAFITLQGVSWARGNLQSCTGAESAGFRSGWKLADEQWMTINYDKKVLSDGSKDYPYDEKPTAMRYVIDPDNCECFNFGGIADYTSIQLADHARASGNFSICGKIFTDQGCSVSAQDFDNAKFGDIAYWASNGSYRLPTLDELKSLSKCDRCYGWVVIPDAGVRVWGMLFTEPAGQEPVVDTNGREIGFDELEEGLFLPLAGRHPDSNNLVINFHTQGVYMSGDAVDKDLITPLGWSQAGDDAYQYANILEVTGGKDITVGYSKGYAYDRRAGFSIRPVSAQ